MATDLDDLPVYDAITQSDGHLSQQWLLSLTRMIETLQEFMGQYGFFVPQITTTQRNEIQSPQNGQMIYNTTTNKFQGYENGAWVNLI